MNRAEHLAESAKVIDAPCTAVGAGGVRDDVNTDRCVTRGDNLRARGLSRRCWGRRDGVDRRDRGGVRGWVGGGLCWRRGGSRALNRAAVCESLGLLRVHESAVAADVGDAANAASGTGGVCDEVDTNADVSVRSNELARVGGGRRLRWKFGWRICWGYSRGVNRSGRGGVSGDGGACNGVAVSERGRLNGGGGPAETTDVVDATNTTTRAGGIRDDIDTDRGITLRYHQ